MNNHANNHLPECDRMGITFSVGQFNPLNHQRGGAMLIDYDSNVRSYLDADPDVKRDQDMRRTAKRLADKNRIAARRASLRAQRGQPVKPLAAFAPMPLAPVSLRLELPARSLPWRSRRARHRSPRRCHRSTRSPPRRSPSRAICGRSTPPSATAGTPPGSANSGKPAGQ
jgi:hypothetical protein